jgi:hypothetical protein
MKEVALDYYHAKVNTSKRPMLNICIVGIDLN